MCLGWVILGCILTGISSQEPAPPIDPWLSRATALYDDLIYDAPRLSQYDRAVMWAKLGESWWATDTERARNWFLKAVDLLEISKEDERSSCRLAAARTVLRIVATRDKVFHHRLMSIIGADAEDQSESQRRENATALAEIGLSLVATDPHAAAKFGEASLRLGFSFRLANLLRALRRQDPAASERLFLQTLNVATTTGEFNFFGMLTAAAFSGPFSSDNEQRLVLSALAGSIPDPQRSSLPNNTTCKMAVFLPQLLAHYDRLLPQESLRIRSASLRCHAAQAAEAGQPSDNSSEQKAPETIDEFLTEATKTRDQWKRQRYWSKAAHMAAEAKDFKRAIDILDSVDEDSRKRMGEGWDDLRRDYAGEAACARLVGNDRPEMIRIIEATPSNLRALVNIFLASNCKGARDSDLVMEFMDAGRKQLEKAPATKQATWYLGLVRLYAEKSAGEAPAVLREAVASINRASEEKINDCESANNVSAVLNVELLLKQYKLPATLLEVDEAGVRNAVESIRPPDKRAAVRLQLLMGALEQHRLAPAKVTASKTTK
jgi:hypothetical protein